MRNPVVATIALVLLESSAASGVAAQSLLDRLADSDVTVRAAAVDTLYDSDPAARPAGWEGAVIGLLEREVAEAEPLPDLEEAHSYGEYLLDLVILVALTDRVEAVRPLAFIGIESTGRAQALVAAHPDVALPALRESWEAEEGMRGAIISTVGLMVELDRRGEIDLTEEQRAEIDLWFLDAASDVSRVPRASLVRTIRALDAFEWLPVVEELSASDEWRFYNFARDALPELQAAERAATADGILERLERLLTAVCHEPVGSERGLCTSLSRHLEGTRSSLERGDPRPARARLSAFRTELQRAAPGALDDRVRLLLDRNAELLRSRL